MKIALLGIGTVGSGVYEMLKNREDLSVKRIFARRPLGEAEPLRTMDFDEILADPKIDAVVEVLGGMEPARTFAEKALRAGKHFVSANKLMISSDMKALTAAAREGKAQMRISASVGGGIPYLHNLLRARRIDVLTEVGGIVNGTTNLILDTMQRDGLDFDVVLKQAQDAGYAEADPSADIDGHDAKCKLAISASTAFNAYVRPEDIAVAGIRMLRGADVANFHTLGRVCRLLTRAAKLENGVCAYVEPTLVRRDAPEAAVYKNDNYIAYTALHAGRQAFIGQGAGKFPTAYAVVNDLEDVRIGAPEPEYVTSSERLCVDNAQERHCYYVRTCAHLPFAAQTIGENAYLTEPVSVQEMHATMQALSKEDPSAFFAGIRD